MRASFRVESKSQLLLRRSLVYCPVIFLVAIIQCSFFAQLKILPAVPDLILGLIVGIAMLDSQKAAVVCGVGAGFVIDAMGSSGLSLSPLFYMLIGALCGALAKKMLPRFLSWALNLLIFSAVKTILTILNLLYMPGGFSLSHSLVPILLPEFICTFIICLPMYFIVKLCMIPIDRKRQLRLDKFN